MTLLWIYLHVMISLSIAFVPADDKYILEGDLVLGGLFPIHSTYKPELEKCLDIQGQDGIQALEAMKYSILTINDNKILPGLSLGMVGVDTCESETISLDNTNELLDMRINKNVNAETCSCKSGDTMKNNLIGVIGPASSKLSIPVASLLRLFKVPQISYQSTSPELSDKTRFQYFKRTVPSDYFQAKAIADLLKDLEYQYISIVYEDSSYGFNFKSMLEKLAMHGNFCVGVSKKLPYDPSDSQNKHIIKTLLKQKNRKDPTVVVLILRPHTAIELFKAVSQTTHAKSFHWIATDGWAGRSFKNNDINDVLEGSVGVQLFMGDIPGFKKYFTKLVDGNPTNPWWQDYTDTDVDGCTQAECNVEEFGILHYINDAVKAFAYAIRGMHEAYCGNIVGLCDSLKIALRDGTRLLEFLGNVSFTDSQREIFQFVNSSEGPARYSILRYSSKKEQWETIGNFSESCRTKGSTLTVEVIPSKVEENIMSLLTVMLYICVREVGDTERLFVNKKHRDDINRGPIVCSHPCPDGYAKSVSDDRCCWICTKCSGNQYSGEFGCMSCPHGFHPNNNKSNCTPIHIDFMSFNDPAAIGTLTVSSIGIAVCIVVIVVFTINRETPLVKATDLKLSLLLVFSLILSYGSSAAFLAKPSPISCGLIRYLLGLCYTLQYATLLTKTIRIYRLFQAKSPEKKKFINSRSSITLTLLITFFHVLGLTAWIIFDRPEIRVDYDEDSGVLICDDADNYSYAISLTYSVALLMTCVYFAVKTRKIPDGFKETRFIAICSYTTCIIWLAFASTFFFTNNNIVRVLSLCITLSINSTVSLCVLFLSRLYIILFKPRLNTRERVMTRGNEKSDRTSKCLTANKSVGTEESSDEYVYTKNGLLAATSTSVPNLAPFASKTKRQFISGAHSLHNISMLNNLGDDNDHPRKTKDIPLKHLPRITISDGETEVNV